MTKLLLYGLGRIGLNIVEDKDITDNEVFYTKQGKVIKNITQEEFEKIKKEYDISKEDWQEEINQKDGIWNLPLNFPMGVADIEHYREELGDSERKKEYIDHFNKVPRFMYNGEDEDIVPGEFAYFDGQTNSGIEVKAGENVYKLEEKSKTPLPEIELAGMHNRVLTNIDTISILFGRSSNERFKNVVQLLEILDIPVISKIYKGFGHCGFQYSGENDGRHAIRGIEGLNSKGIIHSEELHKDAKSFYESIKEGKMPEIEEGAERILPIYQLIRRYLCRGSIEEQEECMNKIVGITRDDLLDGIDQYLSDKIKDRKNVNWDREYDRITQEEISLVFDEILKNRQDDRQSDIQDEKKSFFGKAIKFFKNIFMRTPKSLPEGKKEFKEVSNEMEKYRVIINSSSEPIDKGEVDNKEKEDREEEIGIDK